MNLHLPSGGRPIDPAWLVAEQIAHLFDRPPGVWVLLDPSKPHRAYDVPLRDAAGTIVAYAQPDAA
jgi:hypothetical protein